MGRTLHSLLTQLEAEERWRRLSDAVAKRVYLE